MRGGMQINYVRLLGGWECLWKCLLVCMWLYRIARTLWWPTSGGGGGYGSREG